jgi:hypothetical protein
MHDPNPPHALQSQNLQCSEKNLESGEKQHHGHQGIVAFQNQHLPII